VINKIKSFFNQKSFKKYFSNTVWLLSEKFYRLFIFFILEIFYAKYLGPVKYGELNYVLAFVNIFSIFILLGLDNVIIKKLVMFKSKIDLLLKNAFLLKLSGYIVMSIIMLLLINCCDWFDSLERKLVLVFLVSYFFQVFYFYEYFYQAFLLNKYIFLSKVITLTTVFILRIFIVIYYKSLVLIAITYVIESIMLSMFYIFFFKNKFKKDIYKNTENKKKLKFLILKESFPLMLSGFLVIIYMKIDQIMIKYFLSAKEVGIYSVAVKLTEVWYFIPMIISNALYPLMIKKRQQGVNEYNGLFQKMYFSMVTLAILLIAFTYLFGEKIIILLFGKEYINAYEVLLIYVWASLFVFMGVFASKWMIIERYNKFVLFKSIAGVIINIVLNFLLIPRLGIKGAAIATVVSQLVSSYLFNMFFKELRYNFFMQSKALLLRWK